MSSSHRATNERIAQHLLADGRISERQHAAALDHARDGEIRIEEVLLDAGAIDEPSLLESLATVHGTQFVSTKRLSRARIDKRALRQVPLNVARHLGVYPLVFDETKSVLVIATANPGDEALVKELKLVAVAKQIRLMVARPRAIRCAIARAYEGNSAPFRDLLAEEPAALRG
ncbi:MAG: response regulator, partial [Polyangiaceae bacterium]